MEDLQVAGSNWDERVRMVLASPETLNNIWPHVELLFVEHASVWEEYYTLDSIQQRLQQGTMQLWAMHDGDVFILAMVTELLEFPKLNVLSLLIVVGTELNIARKFLDCIEMWARKRGVNKIVSVGRKGLLRLLAPYGYKEEAVAFSKDISAMKEH